MGETSQTGTTRNVRGMELPSFLYGTAWKEERTEGLVAEALDAGFRGIDTANQRRPYHEAAVGSAVRKGPRAGSARPRRPVPADQVHPRRGTGPQAALRPRRRHPHPGAPVLLQFAEPPGGGAAGQLLAPRAPDPTGDRRGGWLDIAGRYVPDSRVPQPRVACPPAIGLLSIRALSSSAENSRRCRWGHTARPTSAATGTALCWTAPPAAAQSA